GPLKLLAAGWRRLQPPKLLHDQLDHGAGVGAPRASVDGQATDVAESVQAGEHGVDQPSLLANVLEQAGAHPSPEHRVEDIARKPFVVRLRIGRSPNQDVDLFEVFLPAMADLEMRDGPSPIPVWRTRGDVAKCLHRQ